jgi:hypothetical protein
MKFEQLGRGAVEELFQVQRRMANTIMTQAGASKPLKGMAATIERTSLLSWTENVFKEDSWQLERNRGTREELSSSMAEVQAIREEAKRRGKVPVGFPIVEEYFRANCSSLSEFIDINSGRITIQVPAGKTAEMLTSACQLLYELSMAISNDPEGFQIRLTSRNRSRGLESVEDILASLKQE